MERLTERHHLIGSHVEDSANTTFNGTAYRLGQVVRAQELDRRIVQGQRGHQSLAEDLTEIVGTTPDWNRYRAQDGQRGVGGLAHISVGECLQLGPVIPKRVFVTAQRGARLDDEAWI